MVATRSPSFRFLTLALAACLSLVLTTPPAAARSDGRPVDDHSSARVAAPRSDDGFSRVARLPLGNDARAKLAAERMLKAKINASDTSPEAGIQTVFTTRGSKARRGLKVLEIRYGDGTRTSSRHLNISRGHTYAKVGSFTATLVVKDRAGKKAKAKRLIVVHPKPITPDEEFGLGVEPPNPDDEVGIGPGAPTADVGSPGSADLRADAMPVQNQGSIGSCVSWAMAYAMMGWHYHHTYSQTVAFAPMYVFSQTYGGLDAKGQPTGSQPAAAYGVLQNQGVDTAANYGAGWASTWNVKPTAAQTANAANYRISGWGTIFRHTTNWTPTSVGTTSAEIEALKSRLSSGSPVAITFRIRQDFGTYASGWYGGAGALTGGLHEMLALGYNDTGLIIQNSWGTGKGVGGYVYMTWDAVQRDIYEATFANGLVNAASATDTVKPVMSALGANFAPGYVANNAQAPMTFTWGGTDNVGVTQYVLYYRAGGGDWAQLAIGNTQTTATYNLAFGTSYQFAVGAYDDAGNQSDWAMTASFTPANYTESVASYSSGWFSYNDAAYMNGTLYESSQANASMTVNITGTNFGLVSTQGTGGGRAFVYLDGVYQYTIDNYKATASNRTVVAWFNFGSFGSHTVKVVVEGTAGRPYVDIDSFLVS